MALTQALCTSFKKELFEGDHVFGTDVFKLALFDQNSGIAGTYGAATTNYSDMTGGSDEVSGTGYTAGGSNLTTVAPTTSGTTAFVDFNDLVFSTVTLTSRGCMIYNSSKSNQAVGIWDFGSDKTATAGDFTIQFPAADASNAIIRLA